MSIFSCNYSFVAILYLSWKKNFSNNQWEIIQNKSITLSSCIVHFNSTCMLVSHTAPNLIAGFPGHFQYNLNSPDSSCNLEFCITYVLHLGILCTNDFLFPHMFNLWLKILNSLVHRYTVGLRSNPDAWVVFVLYLSYYNNT